jgi:hypothetical protein
MDFLRRFAPCGCIKNQSVGENTDVKENMTISIKTTCCRKTKIININVNHDDLETIKDVKEIIERIENNKRASLMIKKGDL